MFVYPIVISKNNGGYVPGYKNFDKIEYRYFEIDEQYKNEKIPVYSKYNSSNIIRFADKNEKFKVEFFYQKDNSSNLFEKCDFTNKNKHIHYDCSRLEIYNENEYIEPWYLKLYKVEVYLKKYNMFGKPIKFYKESIKRFN